jgi:glutathione peroxidase
MANEPKNIYDIQLESIEGKKYSFSDYKNKTVLIVNTASECGFTPQYKGLQELHERYGNKGLIVLGLPCNQFGHQEPGAEKEIKSFCELRYGVKFPLLKKSDVNGPNRHPLFSYLINHSKDHGDISWNFEKFIVNKKGEVVQRFKSKTEPLDSSLVQALEKELNTH